MYNRISILKKLSYILLVLLLLCLGAQDGFAQHKGKKDKGSKEEQSAKGKGIEYYIFQNEVDVMAVQALYVDATRAKMLDDFQKAVELYKQVLKLDPINDGAQYELALVYFESGQYDAARQHIESAVANDSLNSLVDYVRLKLQKDSLAPVKPLIAEAAENYTTNKWYLVLQADVYAYQGDYDKASDVFALLLHDHPDEVEYYFDWAYVNIKANKLEKALDIYTKAETVIGPDEGLISQKQKLLIQLGRFDEAVKDMKKLVDANKGDVRYLQMLAELYQNNEKIDEAIAIYQDILKSEPHNAFALLNLAEVYKFRGDRTKYMYYLKEAFKDKNLSVDSKIRVIYPYLLGVEDSARKEEAFDLAQIVVETHPDQAKTHAIYGDLLYQDEQKEESLQQYLEALKLDESIYEVWQQVFFILSELNDNVRLAEMTDKALELFPNQPIIYFFNGLANNSLKNYQQSVDILNAGKNLVIGNDNLKIQFYSSLGDAYNSLEQFEKSDEAFEKALEFNKDNSYVLNNYSYYLSLRGEKLERAQEMSLRSNELEPGNSSFEDTYAWILYVSGDYEKALVWIEKAYESGGKESAVILEHYGDILFKLGRKDDAVKYWNMALSHGSESEKLPKKIADKQLYE